MVRVDESWIMSTLESSERGQWHDDRPKTEYYDTT